MIQDILASLNKLQCVSLATCEGDWPKVRPMTLIVYEERFFFATGAADHKAAQLKANPHAEFLLLSSKDQNNGYLRAAGIMSPVADQALRQKIADWAPFIYDYFKDPADPGFALYEFLPSSIAYLKPGEMYESKCEWIR